VTLTYLALPIVTQRLSVSKRAARKSDTNKSQPGLQLWNTPMMVMWISIGIEKVLDRTKKLQP
jgi:hypothetical protein